MRLMEKRKNSFFNNFFYILGSNIIYISIVFFALLPIIFGFHLLQDLFLIPIYFWLIFQKKKVNFFYYMIIAFFLDIIEPKFFGLNIVMVSAIYFFLNYSQTFSIKRNIQESFLGFIVVSFVLYFFKMLAAFVIGTNIIFSNFLLNYFVILLVFIISYPVLFTLNKFVEE